MKTDKRSKVASWIANNSRYMKDEAEEIIEADGIAFFNGKIEGYEFIYYEFPVCQWEIKKSKIYTTK